MQRMLLADDAAIRGGGNLAALCALRDIQIRADDPYLLAAALNGAGSRRSVLEFLAQLVDDLPSTELGVLIIHRPSGARRRRHSASHQVSRRAR
ncbi:hypothetical protein GCM10017581_068750 [Dactylosporangium matsuzakiense]|uniref:Uncharacterized protein n=1 Tax=Dactylosporangium matsuzakiense TaxID=53360 RepID=A0A9W6NQ98_9ACTN|nr:hypothetical protein GCM10017581_068750 [Dactylosporangium matsuzakiense]